MAGWGCFTAARGRNAAADRVRSLHKPKVAVGSLLRRLPQTGYERVTAGRSLLARRHRHVHHHADMMRTATSRTSEFRIRAADAKGRSSIAAQASTGGTDWRHGLRRDGCTFHADGRRYSMPARFCSGQALPHRHRSMSQRSAMSRTARNALR